jgi:hypothetical protein
VGKFEPLGKNFPVVSLKLIFCEKAKIFPTEKPK